MRLKIKNGDDSAVLDAGERKTLRNALDVCRGLRKLCTGKQLQIIMTAEDAVIDLCSEFAPVNEPDTLPVE